MFINIIFPLLLIGFVIIQIPNFLKPVEAQTQLPPLPIEANLLSLQTVSGTFQGTTSLFQYNIDTDFYTVDVDFKLYDIPPPTQVFVLLHPSYQSDNLPLFYSSLRSRLKNSGIGVSLLPWQRLKRISGGAVVIIPTGYVPCFFAEHLDDFVDRPIVFIYIGKKWDMCIDENNVIRPVNSPYSFMAFTGQPQWIKNPEYSVIGAYQLGGVWISKQARALIIFFPQTLDSGYDTGLSAGLKLSKFIASIAWKEPLAHTTVKTKAGQRILIFNNTDPGRYYIMRFYRGNSSVIDTGVIPRTYQGELHFITDPVPYSISNRKVRIQANVPSIVTTPSEVVFEVHSLNGSTVDSYLISNSMVPAGIFDFEYMLELPPGTYIGYLKANKYTLAAVVFKISSVVIKIKSMRPDKGEIYFAAYYGNKEIPMPNAVVYFDNTRFSLDRVTRAIKISGGLPTGEHKIKVVLNGRTVLEKTIKIKGPLDDYIPSEFLPVLGIAVIIIVVTSFFKPKPKVVYRIDIPDFPPLEIKEFKIKPKDVLSIFDQVNKNYGWQRMPLNLEEIKKALKTVLKVPVNVVITDYDVQNLLFRMQLKHLVAERHGYYAPSFWGPISKLVLFRKVRERAMERVIGFEPPEKFNYEYMVLKAEPPLILIPYVDDESLKLALKLKGKRVLLVDEYTRELLNKRLGKTDKLSKAIRVLLYNNELHIMDVDELFSKI